MAAIVKLSPLGVIATLLPATNVKSSLPLPEPPAVNLKIALSPESTQEVLYVVSELAGKVILGVTIVSQP